MPALSVVVPTYNRWEQLQTVLAALARQTVPEAEMEVIVVSDGSTDETDEALAAGRAPLPVTFLSQANQGPAVARNAGVAAARGDLILFIDDDVVAEPGCAAVHLARHDGPFSGPGLVVIGPLLTPDDLELQPWVAWEQAMLYKQYEAMARGDWEPTARQFYTGNASLARDTFTASGGFDPSFRRGEDVELAYRLNDTGATFAFEADARAVHRAVRSYDSWLANATSYGRNDALLWRDRGQRWLLPTIRAEYGGRSLLTRAYTEVGLRVPLVQRLAAAGLPTMVPATARFGLGAVGQRALSAVYNVAYYRGVVDELGGRDVFDAIEPRSASGTLHFDDEPVETNRG